MTVSQLIDALIKLRDAGLGDAKVVSSVIQWGEPTEATVEDVYEDKHEYDSKQRVARIIFD